VVCNLGDPVSNRHPVINSFSQKYFSLAFSTYFLPAFFGFVFTASADEERKAAATVSFWRCVRVCVRERGNVCVCEERVCVRVFCLVGEVI